MLYKEETLGASFELPVDPDFGQIDQFDTKLQAAFGSQAEMTDAQYSGALVKTAAEVGLIQKWECVTRPGVPLSNLAKQDGRVIAWAGLVLRGYLRQVKTVDPKACGPWLPMREETERPLLG